MKNFATAWIVLALMLHGCAATPAKSPRIERLGVEQLAARLPQPAAALPLERIVALAKQGVADDDLMARIAASGSRYRLSASMIIDLAAQGVPLKVLDHMVDSERQYLFDDQAAAASRAEQACQQRVEKELVLCRAQAMQAPWHPWPQPFGTCLPSPGGWLNWHCR
jgi:hypothetical protein